MTFVITAACIDVTDGACLTVCPVECIYEGKRSRYINPAECIDCGACEPVCPVGAIYNEFDVPDDLSRFTEDNAAFFAEPLEPDGAPLGNPGGEKNIGKVGRDTPFVAAYKGETGV